jgi:hypothetical protein
VESALKGEIMKTKTILHFWKTSSIKQKLIAMGILALLSLGALGAMGEFSDDKKDGILSGIAETIGLKEKSSNTGDSLNETLTPPNGTLQLSKEYVYAGSRMVATEDYGTANANPTPTPPLNQLTLPTSGQYYQLIAKHSNKCADVSGISQNNGAGLWQISCLGVQQSNQTWKFTQVGDAWEIRTGHSNKCMDVSGISQENAAQIWQWDCHGGLNQLWKLIQVGDAWQLVSKNSNKCLEVAGGPGSTGDTAQLQQYDCLGSSATNQLWTLNATALFPTSGNYYQIIAKHSNKCADVSGISQNNGAGIWQINCLGVQQTNQLWRFTQVGDAWEIRAGHSNKCMDVAGFSQDNGGTIHQWDCHGGLNQQWQLVQVGNTWRIVSKNSNKVLDVAGGPGEMSDGAGLQQWDFLGAQQTNQLWTLNQVPTP